MQCLKLSIPLIKRLIRFDVITSGFDTAWFVSDNKKLAQEVLDFFEALPYDSSIIKTLTLGIKLYSNEKRFQMVYVHDTSIISPNQFPLNFICFNGVLNEVGNTITQSQQYHNIYYDTVELQQIRDVFGESIA